MIEVVEKYSQSLFEVSLKYEQLELIFDQLSAVDQIFNNHEIIEYFLSPMVIFVDKQKLIYNYFNNFDIKVINFLCVLIKNRRINLVHEIFEDFRLLYYKYEGIKLIKIKSSYELSSNEKMLINQKLVNKFGSKIHIDYFIDDSLKAGYIMEVDDRILDTSLKTKLSKLRVLMNSGGN